MATKKPLFLGLGFIGACLFNISCIILLSAFTQAKEQAEPSVRIQQVHIQQQEILRKQQRKQQQEQHVKQALPPLPQLPQQRTANQFSFPTQALATIQKADWRSFASLDQQFATNAQLTLDKRAVRKFVPDLSRFYPKRAKRRGIKGHSVIDLYIGIDGVVERYDIIESVPTDVFDDAIKKVVERIRYEPAQANGEAAKDKQRIKLVWSLE